MTNTYSDSKIKERKTSKHPIVTTRTDSKKEEKEEGKERERDWLEKNMESTFNHL